MFYKIFKSKSPQYLFKLIPDSKILESTDSYVTLLFGFTLFDSETSTFILNATIDYIDSKNLFHKKNLVFHKQLFNPFKTSRG